MGTDFLFFLTSYHRLTLNYKRIPYKTLWVENNDVQRAMKEAGATPLPAHRWLDGVARYSSPSIKNPVSGEVISHSFDIARYLDRKFPDRPVLVPVGTEAEQDKFAESLLELIDPVRLLSLEYAYIPLICVPRHF
jgi:hypothetical protein